MKKKLRRIKLMYKNKWYVTYSLYECYCGNLFITRDSAVKAGTTKSCGCYDKERRKNNNYGFKHGHARVNKQSLTYVSWYNMISRCSNPNYTNFEYWGGKGIKVCERWLIFENFLEDMGERILNTSLDRIDGDKDYYKENCRWATRLEQNQNRQYNRSKK